MQASTEIQTIEPRVAELRKMFGTTEQQVKKIIESNADLSINGIDDKDNYKAVCSALSEARTVRLKIERAAKEAREDAVTWQKTVIKESGELIDPLKSEEARLKGLRDEVDREKERIKQDKANKESYVGRI